MKLAIVTLLLVAQNLWALAVPNEVREAVGKIAKGEIVQFQSGVEGLALTHKLKIKEKDNSLIEVEIRQKDLQVVEAEGSTLTSDFRPGQGLKSLSELQAKVMAPGGRTIKEWALERKWNGDWIYEVSLIENGQGKELEFNAKTLDLIKTEKD